MEKRGSCSFETNNYRYEYIVHFYTPGPAMLIARSLCCCSVRSAISSACSSINRSRCTWNTRSDTFMWCTCCLQRLVLRSTSCTASSMPRIASSEPWIRLIWRMAHSICVRSSCIDIGERSSHLIFRYWNLEGTSRELARFLY